MPNLKSSEIISSSEETGLERPGDLLLFPSGKGWCRCPSWMSASLLRWSRGLGESGCSALLTERSAANASLSQAVGFSVPEDLTQHFAHDDHAGLATAEALRAWLWPVQTWLFHLENEVIARNTFQVLIWLWNSVILNVYEGNSLFIRNIWRSRDYQSSMEVFTWSFSRLGTD